MNVNSQYYTIIENISNGAETWKRLMKHFRPDSRTRVMVLKKDFFSCIVEPEETVGHYVKRIMQ